MGELTQKDIDKFQEESARRSAEREAALVKDARKEKQRATASKVMSKRVHDVVEFVSDFGDDVVVFVYVPLKVGTALQRDILPADEVILQVLYLETERMMIHFEEARYNGKDYVDLKGEKIFMKAVKGLYL